MQFPTGSSTTSLLNGCRVCNHLQPSSVFLRPFQFRPIPLKCQTGHKRKGIWHTQKGKGPCTSNVEEDAAVGQKGTPACPATKDCPVSSWMRKCEYRKGFEVVPCFMSSSKFLSETGFVARVKNFEAGKEQAVCARENGKKPQHILSATSKRKHSTLVWNPVETRGFLFIQPFCKAVSRTCGIVMRWNTKKEEKSNEKQKGILLGRLKEKKRIFTVKL